MAISANFGWLALPIDWRAELVVLSLALLSQPALCPSR
jgi:hypothetical protein